MGSYDLNDRITAKYHLKVHFMNELQNAEQIGAAIGAAFAAQDGLFSVQDVEEAIKIAYATGAAHGAAQALQALASEVQQNA